jgi:hypothetical protein
MATATFTVQARVGDSIEINPPETKGAPLTLVIVWADGRTEIRPTDIHCRWAGWSGEPVRSIDVVFVSTNVCVHYKTPEPGPQTEAEYQALVEEVRGALARGETTQLGAGRA